MIDGINCRVHGESYRNIMHCDKLQYKNYPNRTEAKYKGLIVTIYKDAMTCYLRGSIHLFRNNGQHNADLFTYQCFVSSLKKLEEELGIYCSDLQIVRFEIGVNVPLSYPPWQCLNTISEIQNSMPTKKRNSLFVEYTQYTIKVYSKSKQYKEFKDQNILRIEIAYLKKQKLTQDIGRLSTFDELLNYTIWEKIAVVLRKLVSKFIFFDYSEMENKKLATDEALLFYEWSNAVRISQEPSRSRVSRMRKRVIEIYQKYSENRKARELLKQVDEKLKESLRFSATAATILPII